MTWTTNTGASLQHRTCVVSKAPAVVLAGRRPENATTQRYGQETAGLRTGERSRWACSGSGWNCSGRHASRWAVRHCGSTPVRRSGCSPTWPAVSGATGATSWPRCCGRRGTRPTLGRRCAARSPCSTTPWASPAPPRSSSPTARCWSCGRRRSTSTCTASGSWWPPATLMDTNRIGRARCAPGRSSRRSRCIAATSWPAFRCGTHRSSRTGSSHRPRPCAGSWPARCGGWSPRTPSRSAGTRRSPPPSGGLRWIPCTSPHTGSSCACTRGAASAPPPSASTASASASSTKNSVWHPSRRPPPCTRRSSRTAPARRPRRPPQPPHPPGRQVRRRAALSLSRHRPAAVGPRSRWSGVPSSGPRCWTPGQRCSGTAGAEWSRSPARRASARRGWPMSSRHTSWPRAGRRSPAAAMRGSAWPTGPSPTGCAPPWQRHAALPGSVTWIRPGSPRPPGSCPSWPRSCPTRRSLPRGHRLRRLVAQAQQAGTVTSLELGRLDRSTVAELVGMVAPARAGVADELYERSEGLPLLLIAYLGVLDGDDASALPTLTAGIRELFQARLEQVSEAAWQLLTTAAVIGRSFDVDAVRKASGRSDDEVIGALEELVRLGLIHEVPVTGPAASYDFGHEQMRMLVYEQAGLARRRLLHRRVALALASPVRGSTHGHSRAAVAQAASIARHFQLGGQDAEAAEWFARAGQRAAALSANRDAVAHYQAALALGHPDPGGLHQAVGDLHVLLGEYGPALLNYEAAAAQADGLTLASLEHKLAGLHHRTGDWAAADSHFAAASTLLDREDSPAANARLRADWSLTAHRRGQPGRAFDLARNALALAQQARDTQALAQAHNILGMLASSRGDPAGGREHLERSLALAETLPDPSARIAALNNLALTSRAAGDLGHALDLTRTALALCASQGDRHREAALHSNLADLLHATGRHEEALAHLKQAAAIFAQVGGPEGHLQPEIWKLVEW